jgi:hypothetical protein
MRGENRPLHGAAGPPERHAPEGGIAAPGGNPGAETCGTITRHGEVAEWLKAAPC